MTMGAATSAVPAAGGRFKPMQVIAIDGPAGSGKSTVARQLADRLGLRYLDTGAMYRAVTFAVLHRSIDPDDQPEVAALVERLEIDVDDATVRVDGVDATIEIRGPEVTRAVSAVAANPRVREVLRTQQRSWAEEHGGGVVEGRDIGSVVFPDARLKVYLHASPDARAERRLKESNGLELERVAADIARRDAFDSSRRHDPLTQADGAVELDTTNLSVGGVVDAILGLLDG
jgi:cytidylate kinase